MYVTICLKCRLCLLPGSPSSNHFSAFVSPAGSVDDSRSVWKYWVNKTAHLSQIRDASSNDPSSYCCVGLPGLPCTAFFEMLLQASSEPIQTASWNLKQ